MDWLDEFKSAHRTGYAHKGKCLSCRRDRETCPGGRYRNECPNYVDNSPTKEEYLKQYSALLKELFAAEGEPARGDLYGAAQSRRKFLQNWMKIGEKDIRAAEDSAYHAGEQNERDLRRLRWQL